MERPIAVDDGNSRFVLDPFEPAYLALERSGEMRNRVRRALEGLGDCHACPQNCRVNRL
jgi:putative pyruvate formate lyase activating enzyme